MSKENDMPADGEWAGDGETLPSSEGVPEKRFAETKGTLKGWTPDSAEWYERASEYTGYHDRLLESLLRFLKPDDRCCEIACGTGILARKTAPHVASYLANDADPVAVAFLKEKLRAPDAPPVEVLEGKWQDVLKDRTCDVLLTSYYGIPVASWPLLKTIAARSLIMICPRDRHWGKVRGREQTAGGEAQPVVRKLETPEHIKTFLKEQGIPFGAIPLDLEFGQPFRDVEEAVAYVRYYYRLEGADAQRFVEEKTGMQNGTLYFPKKKEIEMIAANLRP